MTNYVIGKLRSIAEGAKQGGQDLTPNFQTTIEKIKNVIDRYEASWSGSQFGYHARVYYRGFVTPAPGHHFSVEWGINPPPFIQGTVGNWQEYPFQGVIDQILSDAGNPNLAPLESVSERVKDLFSNLKDSFDSLLTLTQSSTSDSYIDQIRTQSSDLSIPNLADAIRYQYRNIRGSSRDSLAMSQGLMTAPHQELLAKIVVLNSPFNLCADLSKLCTKLADHLENLQTATIMNDGALPLSNSQGRGAVGAMILTGTKVFIGHGGSQEWRKLKEYLTDTLHLDCDEFNRVPIAGVTNIDRLNAMLEDAQIAVVVMTAEDEVDGGATRARENVIHEAGLFQGRLGFEKTILLSENTCNIFSNIDGLGRIEFSHENIAETFEKVREVLVREQVIAN